MKIRKTLTNIKKIERVKVTVIFVVLEVIIIGLFTFGMIKTVPVKAENVSVSEGKIENYRFIARPARRGWNYTLNCEMHGEEYKIFVSSNKKEHIEGLLQAHSVAEIGSVKGEVVFYSIDGIELYSINEFNSGQKSERILAIVLFSIVEIVSIPLFTLYIIYHRTSKDPIIKKKKAR